MDELNLKTLEQIPIPEGLEERLSAKIDEWEREEKKPRRRRPRLTNGSVRRKSPDAASACCATWLPLPASPLSLAWGII